MKRLLPVLLRLPGSDGLLVGGLGSRVRRSLLLLLLHAQLFQIGDVGLLLTLEFLLVGAFGLIDKVEFGLHAGFSRRFTGMVGGLGILSGLLGCKCLLLFAFGCGNLEVDGSHSFSKHALVSLGLSYRRIRSV